MWRVVGLSLYRSMAYPRSVCTSSETRPPVGRDVSGGRSNVSFARLPPEGRRARLRSTHARTHARTHERIRCVCSVHRCRAVSTSVAYMIRSFWDTDTSSKGILGIDTYLLESNSTVSIVSRFITCLADNSTLIHRVGN